MDEAELIGAAQSGDRQAFDELVRRTFVDTFTLARRLTGNEEDARDVVQEAYLRAWKGIGKFRGEAAVLDVDVPHHREHRRRPSCASAAASAPSRSPTTSSPPTRSAEEQPVSQAPSRPRRSTASSAALDELPAEAPVGRRAEGRLRPAARGDRRGARHLGLGGEGAAAPGPAQAARRCSTKKEPKPMRCDEVDRAAARRSSTATTVEPRRRAPRRSRACAARPSWPATAGCCARSRCCGRATSSRRPGLLGDTLAAIADAAERGACRTLLSGPPPRVRRCDRWQRARGRCHRGAAHRPVAQRRGAPPRQLSGRRGDPGAGRGRPDGAPLLSLLRPPGLAHRPEGSSSIGRASVSKTDGWGFESLLPCSLPMLAEIAENSDRRRGDR